MWAEIKEKYPKAYEKYALYLNYDCDRRDCNCSLYKFFDEQGIMIAISVLPYTDIVGLYGYVYGYDIFVKAHNIYSESYESRQEAEETAFKKTFEILEER
jgi:hypothetical protein